MAWALIKQNKAGLMCHNHLLTDGDKGAINVPPVGPGLLGSLKELGARAIT